MAEGDGQPLADGGTGAWAPSRGPSAPRYEPPRVERVLGPTDLDREIQYAGLVTLDTDNDAN
jgi:hypothetical protein